MGQPVIGGIRPLDSARGREPVERQAHAALSLSKGEARTVQMPCAFCRGTGKDPFGIMSSLSACCVCSGSGTVAVAVSYERCAHCRGTGAVKRLTCMVCGGKGVVPALEGSTEVCPKCGGTGDDSSAPAMDCLECCGRGKVPVAAADKKTR